MSRRCAYENISATFFQPKWNRVNYNIYIIPKYSPFLGSDNALSPSRKTTIVPTTNTNVTAVTFGNHRATPRYCVARLLQFSSIGGVCVCARLCNARNIHWSVRSVLAWKLNARSSTTATKRRTTRMRPLRRLDARHRRRRPKSRPSTTDRNDSSVEAAEEFGTTRPWDNGRTVSARVSFLLLISQIWASLMYETWNFFFVTLCSIFCIVTSASTYIYTHRIRVYITDEYVKNGSLPPPQRSFD